MLVRVKPQILVTYLENMKRHYIKRLDVAIIDLKSFIDEYDKMIERARSGKSIDEPLRGSYHVNVFSRGVYAVPIISTPQEIDEEVVKKRGLYKAFEAKTCIILKNFGILSENDLEILSE